MLLAIVVIAVIASVVLVTRQDPYRPGTTHEAVLDPGSDVEACGPAWIVELEDGSKWIPAGPVAIDPPVPVSGTVTITAEDRAEFQRGTSDRAVTIEMVRGSLALVCTPPS